MLKPQKFMIYGDRILLGRVNLHRELLPPNPDYTKIYGGGMFEIDRENKVIRLHGYSSDFGSFCPKLVANLPFEDNRLQGYEREIVPGKYDS